MVAKDNPWYQNKIQAFYLHLIQDILVGREQIKAGQGTPYIFAEGE